MRPKKEWGQNFLRNRGAVEKIVAAVEAAPDELVLEIGPGEGALTSRLLDLYPGRVTAIEIDPELADSLRSRFPTLDVINDDALEVALPTRPFRAVGNLPYNVGTPILRRVIADPHFKRAVFMLQKEVAQRLVAKPGTEHYGFLTLYTQLYATAKTLMTLDPGSFFPPPKVRSAVVVLEPVANPVRDDALIDLISSAFRMRRKKLVNNLTDWNGLSRDDLLRAMSGAGIDTDARAEVLSLGQFQALFLCTREVTER
jgi:16S rRNA (adenine1518-N6/adenine1519-N6)-dimethyltransferase